MMGSFPGSDHIVKKDVAIITHVLAYEEEATNQKHEVNKTEDRNNSFLALIGGLSLFAIIIVILIVAYKYKK